MSTTAEAATAIRPFPDTATYNAGEALMVPAEKVHAVRNVVSGNAAELATYDVESDKPFLVVVD
jgi:hypothetical protein